MRLAIRRSCRQRGIETTESARQVAALFPAFGTHACDGKIGHGDIAGFDVDEQDRCQRLGAQGAQQARLADAGGADDKDLCAAFFCETLVGRDDFHHVLQSLFAKSRSKRWSASKSKRSMS